MPMFFKARLLVGGSIEIRILNISKILNSFIGSELEVLLFLIHKLDQIKIILYFVCPSYDNAKLKVHMGLLANL